VDSCVWQLEAICHLERDRLLVYSWSVMPLAAGRVSSFLLAVALAASPLPALAQVHEGNATSAPLSDVSTNVRAGSRSVYGSRSVRGGSSGPVGGSPVRYSSTGSVRSGPVSEVSVGPVTSDRPVSGGGTVTDASEGAVLDAPHPAVGEVVSEAVPDLRPLQEQLRAIVPLPPEPAAEAEGAIAEATPASEPDISEEPTAEEEETESTAAVESAREEEAPPAAEAAVAEPALESEEHPSDTDAAPESQPPEAEQTEPAVGPESGEPEAAEGANPDEEVPAGDAAAPPEGEP
jgi:hypothetical protein